MIKNDFSLFQRHCEKALAHLTESCIERFRETKDEESRIKLMYEIVLKLPIGVTDNNGKDLTTANQLRDKGNAYFAQKDYDNALKSYNDGIIKCPQSSSTYFLHLNVLSKIHYFELGIKPTFKVKLVFIKFK